MHVTHPKKKFSREFGLHWLYRMSRNFVVRMTSLRRHNDVKFKNGLRQLHCVWYWMLLLNKTFKIKRYARKKIKHDCSVWTENSIPPDQCFALSKASWCHTVTLGTEFSICTSHPCKVLILSIVPITKILRLASYCRWAGCSESYLVT